MWQNLMLHQLSLLTVLAHLLTLNRSWFIHYFTTWKIVGSLGDQRILIFLPKNLFFFFPISSFLCIFLWYPISRSVNAVTSVIIFEVLFFSCENLIECYCCWKLCIEWLTVWTSILYLVYRFLDARLVIHVAIWNWYINILLSKWKRNISTWKLTKTSFWQGE